MTTMDCPTCGHPVKVVGDTTQHFEPVDCVTVQGGFTAAEAAPCLSALIDAEDALAAICRETEDRRFGKRMYDVTHDQLWEVAAPALASVQEALRAVAHGAGEGKVDHAT